MTNKEKKHLSKVSRLLARVLRHAPEDIGLSLDSEGWVDVPDLLTALKANGFAISADQLQVIVDTSDKKRFTLSDGRIRAAQGHSVPVDLGVAAVTPPDTLYHGTAKRTAGVIMTEGLKPMNRQQVHLSADRDTALKVGQRHGLPVILLVNTAAMSKAGHLFYQADNGVWLTDAVPPEFLQRADMT